MTPRELAKGEQVMRALKRAGLWEREPKDEPSRALNESLTTGKTQAVDVASRAKKIEPKTLSMITSLMAENAVTGESPSIWKVMYDPVDSMSLVRAMSADGVLSYADLEKFLDTGTGLLNEQGMITIERILMARVVDDPSLIGLMAPAVQQKLLAGLSGLARAMDADPNVSIVVKDVVRSYNDFTASNLSINDYFFGQMTFNPPKWFGDIKVASLDHAIGTKGTQSFSEAANMLADEIKSGNNLDSAFYLSFGGGVKGANVEAALRTLGIDTEAASSGALLGAPTKPPANPNSQPEPTTPEPKPEDKTSGVAAGTIRRVCREGD